MLLPRPAVRRAARRTHTCAQINAYGLELYNEDLRDLALAGGRDETAKGWDGKGGSTSALKLQERPVGKDGRVVPEVRGRRGVGVG